MDPFSPKNRSSDNQNQMIPLMNVVFLILLFLMAVGRFKSASPVQTTPPLSINLEKNIQEYDTVFVSNDGQWAYQNQIVTPDDLITILQEQFLANGVFPLTINTDRDTDVYTILPIVENLKSIGFTQIELLTIAIQTGGQS